MMPSDYWQGLFAFTGAVEAGSFTGAARTLGLTPSAVGRAVTRLEQRLGVTLLRRSTRSLALTPEGQDFLEQVAPALAALRDAERALSHERGVVGTVRVSASIDLGRMLVASWSAELAREYPDLRLELDVTDRLVDLRREGVDIAVRVGSLPPAGLAGTRIGAIGYAVVAAPAYLAARGTPNEPADLAAHDCLQYLTNDGSPLPWRFSGDDLPTEGTFATGDGGALRSATLAGAGVAYMLRFAIEDALEDGRLIELMADLPKAKLPVSLSHPFGPRPPARVRTVVDFLQRRLTRVR